MSRSPIRKTCFRILVALIALSLLNAGCMPVSRKFAGWQFDRDVSLNRELANKKVEVYLRNDEQVTGYFYFMDRDSLFITPAKNSLSGIAISREEIQSISAKENKHLEIIVILILAAVMIWVATIGFGDYIDGAGH